MSRFPIPRGTARAICRGNAAPSIGFSPMRVNEQAWGDPTDDDYESRQRYRDLREEGYSRYQAMLMSGLADPDSL